MIFKHAYILNNGILFCDYKLYTDRKFYNDITKLDEYVVMTDDVFNGLYYRSNFNKICDQNFQPNRDDEIYVGPNCKYASADIRRNYKVKREPDAGVCNVLSPIKSWDRHFSNSKMLIVMGIQSVFCTDENDPVAFARTFVPDIDKLSYTLVEPAGWFRVCRLPEVYKKFLNKELKKPVISEDRLKITSDNKLTVDILRMTYEASKAWYHEKDAEKNMQIQLNVLNQTDWRDYKGTISLLNELMYNKKGIAYMMMGTKSRYPKPIQEILQCTDCFDPISSEDRNLGAHFLAAIMGIDGTKFIDAPGFYKKLGETGITVNTFSRFFQTLVRVKTY